MALLPPKVIGPLSECSSRVIVEGQLSGTQVEVFADGAPVANGTAIGPRQSFTLSTPLTPGQRVTARQTDGIDLSPESPDAVIVQQRPPIIGPVAYRSHLHVCGECVWIEGAVPGATVEINSTFGFRGSAESYNGNARIGLNAPIAPGEVLVATQIACGSSGPGSPGSIPDMPGGSEERNRLPKPTVEPPLHACQRGVVVSNVFEGARVTLLRSGGPDREACFDAPSLRFTVNPGLVEGETVSARQEFRHCSIISDDADPVTVGPAEPVPPPVVQPPLCERATNVRLHNLLFGSKVRILLDGVELGIAESPVEGTYDFPVPPLPRGAKVTAQQELCSIWSAESSSVLVNPLTEDVLPPVITKPLIECAAAVHVTNIFPGARVLIISAMLGAPIGVQHIYDTEGLVSVAPLLIAGDEIHAIQIGCSKASDPSDVAIVQPIEEIPVPQIVPPVYDCESSISVTGVISGARVEIFVNGAYRGSALAGSDPTEVPIIGTLEVGDQVQARQRLCEHTTRLGRSVRVEKFGGLTIDGMEITQAIQYYRAAQHLNDSTDRGPDNSLRLVTNKTAWVRVYLRSGSGQLPGVEGSLRVERRINNVWSAVTDLPSQNGPIPAEEGFVNYNAERGNINNSLNFVVPANIMTGLLRLTANVAVEHVGCLKNRASAQTVVDVNLTQTLNAAFITIGYNGPNATNTGNLTLAAPTLPQCQAETGWAMRTYPISGAPNVRVAGTFITNTPLNDPRTSPGSCSPNWRPLLRRVAQLVAADQMANPGGNWVYYGLVTNGIPVTVPGCNGWGATGGLVGNQNGITYAHEIGHQFGLQHAPCGAVGTTNPAYPVYEPYSMASIGEYGLDINNGNIANPNNAEDFMSYCGPRWISLFTHNFLINAPGLAPQTIPTGSGAATDRIIQDEEIAFVRNENVIEPLIYIFGEVGSDEDVQVTDVARLETRYMVGSGQPTDFIAQLLNENGDIIAQDVLYRYESEGCAGGRDSGCCDDDKQASSFLFKAMLNDVAPGSSLRIVKGDDVMWERTGQYSPPQFAGIDVSLDEARNLRLFWRLEKESEIEEDIWVRWSQDGGKAWHALTVGLRGSSAILETTGVPAGDTIFQIMAHDGFYTTSQTTSHVEMPYKAPQATIYYPAEDDRVYAETKLHLWGAATSFVDNELSDEQFVWYINDEEVGRGRDIWVNNPGEGNHQVELVVIDSGGTSNTFSRITIT